MFDGQPSRREVLCTVAAAGALAGCDGSGEETPGDQSTKTTIDDGETPAPDGLADLTLSAEVIADGFTAPIDVAAPVAGELLVVDQIGTVTRILETEEVETQTLDIRDRVVDVSGYDERGLLGIALHPGYPENGRLYLRYSAPPRPGTPDDYSHTFVLAEFTANPEQGTIDPASERTLLEIPQPQSNHNAGPIAFGPDGYLYVTTGDGGAANDQGMGHVEDWYGAVEGGNGQDVTENLLGGVLRIDVDDRASVRGEEKEYAIPDDNPLVDADGLEEYYAWGLRNPFGITFGPQGRCFVADVGQNRFEEVNIIERGGNFGWNVKEGHVCFKADRCPDSTPDGNSFVDPIVAYHHSSGDVNGAAVIGGQLYDGQSMPTLRETYVFGDWQADGELFVATEDAGAWSAHPVPLQGDVGTFLLGTGSDADDEVLVLTSEGTEATGTTGTVARLSEV